MDSEEAKSKLEVAERRGHDLADWIDKVKFEVSEDDAEFLSMLLVKTAMFTPVALVDAKIFACLTTACFAAGYRKGQEVTELKNLMER